ncbi:glycosyltransferase [Kitasatospora nipponensis]|uniref:D-inositol 3-phosphate glycosyltransferase n=1 Tax=Kitasatospora nipponensis TaxID=258049 RepID=A0ABP4DQG2_9ACTN
MRIALLTEGVRPPAQRAEGGWCDRLTEGLAEHEFERYALLSGGPAGPVAPGVRTLELRGPRPAGRAPGAVRRRAYARAYEQLVGALVLPRERAGFAPGLHRLAELGRQDGALPAFLASGHAHRVLERSWRSPGADTAAGAPLVRDVLVAGDLLEQCLRPLSADWYGAGALGGVDLCHVVGGGPAALPALVAKQLHGVPFVLTEHGLHLREQYLGYRQAPYRWPVRALLLSFFRLLTAETYRQAALLTPGSGYDREWQLRCGARPERIRVVYRGTAAVDRPAAGDEPGQPTLAWSGRLEPAADPELMLHAFARVRAQAPGARLRMYGVEGPPGYLEHCRAVAARLGLSTALARDEAAAERAQMRDEPDGPARSEEPAAVVFGGPLRTPDAAWASGTVAVFSARAQRSPRPLVDAMLSGRAVVATDVGVVREALGPAGLLVPPRDPAALALACLALLGDEERRGRLGLAGRLRAQERFAVEPVVSAFREVYLELVSQWPAFPATERRAGALPRPFARPAEYWVAGSTETVTGGAPGPARPAAGPGAGPAAGGATRPMAETTGETADAPVAAAAGEPAGGDGPAARATGSRQAAGALAGAD